MTEGNESSQKLFVMIRFGIGMHIGDHLFRIGVC